MSPKCILLLWVNNESSLLRKRKAAIKTEWFYLLTWKRSWWPMILKAWPERVYDRKSRHSCQLSAIAAFPCFPIMNSSGYLSWPAPISEHKRYDPTRLSLSVVSLGRHVPATRQGYWRTQCSTPGWHADMWQKSSGSTKFPPLKDDTQTTCMYENWCSSKKFLEIDEWTKQLERSINDDLWNIGSSL